MTKIVFQPWSKTTRRFDETVTVTLKIDGTNAAVGVSEDGTEVWAQSRKRLITPEGDNFSFAKWVHANAGALVDTLGPGVHFGEWHGKGIQRGYGLDEKRLALFNTRRWAGHEDDLAAVDGLTVVPVLRDAVRNSDDVVREALAELEANGHPMFPGWDRHEGVVIYHHDSQQREKAFVSTDAGFKLSKWQQKP